MKKSNQFRQPMDFYGTYRTNSWAGYVFKEVLGYTSGFHTGVDYNGPGAGNADLGMEARSVAYGIVRYTGNRTDIGFGNTIIIEHPLSPTLKNELGCDSLFSRSMHLNTIEVGVGQEVGMGQRIGSVGNTGTQWAHLHVDLYKSTISYGGVHFNYDKDTQMASYLDTFEFIQAHLNPVDISPPATIQPFQRVLENREGVNQREAPNTDSRVIKEWPYDEVPFDFKGYVKGQDPYGNGNNIWYVGAYSGGYFYSGAFTDKSTNGLKDLTPTTPPVVPPVKPPEEKPYTFTKDFDFVTEVFPAAIGNFEVGNFPASTDGIILHDFGTAGKDTWQSAKNEFTRKGSEKSIHLMFSQDKVGQNVKIGDRAYHAGPNGNVKYGFELDPAYVNDPVQISNVRKAIKALQIKENKKLKLYKHSEFMQTQCGDDITLSIYDVPFGEPTPPSDDKIDKNIVILFLEGIVNTISAFIKNLKGDK